MTTPTIHSPAAAARRTVTSRRLAATVIDGFAFGMVALVLRRVLGPGLTSTAVIAIVAVATFGVVQGETGRTIGKSLTDLRLVDERGKPPGTAKALIRLAAWAVDGLPCLGALGLLMIWFTPGHQRIGDLVTRTSVISTRPEPTAPRPAVASGPAPQHYSASDPEQAQHFDPIWDPKLEAYVQWDPAEKRWMKYDDVLGGWGPVDPI